MSHPNEPTEATNAAADDGQPETCGLEALLVSLLPHLDPVVVRQVLGLPPADEADRRVS